MIPRVLSIAGTDPTGGAGIHADLKSISAAGGYAMGAVTAVVAQNTHGVTDIHYPPVEALTAQLEAVSSDIQIDAVKIGMLGRVDYIDAVRAWLEKTAPKVLVLDPVMVATSGDRLIDEQAEEHLRQLFDFATVITPNTPELEILVGAQRGEIRGVDDAVDAARRLAAETGSWVAVKGGHLEGSEISNYLVSAEGSLAETRSARIETSSTHGTGCSQSSALATRLAAGDSGQEALDWVSSWLTESIARADQLQVGSGNGPIDHFFRMRKFSHPEELVGPSLAHTAVLGELAEPVAVPESQAEKPLQTIEPAGPWTAMLAGLSENILQQTIGDGFLTALQSGSLSTREFVAYQVQDALYLERYAKALSLLAAKSPLQEETAFWAGSASNTYEVEQELHRSWLARREVADFLKTVPSAPSKVTSGYTDFLLARATIDDYVVGAAAVLPCFWMYADISLYMAEANRPDHPYRSWLETYQDQDFVLATQKAIAIVERLFEEARPDQRERATRAYLEACLWEREFFQQASYL